LQFADNAPKYQAGIFYFANSDFEIPAHSLNHTVDISCQYSSVPITVFAWRMHTHSHGDFNSAYRLRDNKWTQLAIGDPQLPQAFYPTKTLLDILPQDKLFARCIFHNEKNVSISVGETHDDEMCNVYLMYFTERKVMKGTLEPALQDLQEGCFSRQFPEIDKYLPGVSLKKQPPVVVQFESRKPGANETAKIGPDSGRFLVLFVVLTGPLVLVLTLLACPLVVVRCLRCAKKRRGIILIGSEYEERVQLNLLQDSNSVSESD